MSKNRGVVYIKPGVVEVRDIADPKFEDPHGRKINHAVILKIVSTNICGSDQHMVRGRTTAPAGLVLGHEITGEVIEKGVDVEFLDVGDIVSVPFNVACGRCRTCRAGDTGVCLTVNPGLPGGAYGYVDMGGWIGGQARYVMTPYADFNLLKFPDREQALAKIRDLTMLTDILPTGFHAAVRAKSASAPLYISQAADRSVWQLRRPRDSWRSGRNDWRHEQGAPAHAKKVGFEPIDLNAHDRLGELVAAVIGEPVVDSFIDAVGFEAKGHGGAEQPAVVLNQAMEVTRYAGSIGIPGLYVTKDPGSHDKQAAKGALSLNFGLGWSKSHSFLPARRRSCATIASSCRRSCTIASHRGRRQCAGDHARGSAQRLCRFRQGRAREVHPRPARNRSEGGLRLGTTEQEFCLLASSSTF